MYYNQLEKWTSLEWGELLKDVPSLNEEQKERLKFILKSEAKAELMLHFPELKTMGVWNWICPNWAWKFFRGIISLLFKWVRYEFHDIGYLIWGTKEDRKKADLGLVYYSIKTIRDQYLKIKGIDMVLFSQIAFRGMFFILCFFQISVILFCYLMVRSLWWYKSFRYY